MKNKQTITYIELARKNKLKDGQAQERTDFWDTHGQVTVVVCTIAQIECCI